MTAAEAWATPGAITLDGTDDWVDLNSPSVLEFGSSDPYSISFWIKVPAGAARGIVLAYSANLGKGWYIGYNDISIWNTKSIFSDYYDGGVSTSVGSETNSIVDDTWHHVVFIRPSNTAADHSIHIDGVSQTMRIRTSGTPASIAYDATTEAQVGARDGGIPLDGLLDDVLTCSRALTTNEVATLYRLGPGGMYRRQLQHNVKAPATGRINSLVGVGGGMIGYGGGMIGRGY
jgi:hypothetical protein